MLSTNYFFGTEIRGNKWEVSLKSWKSRFFRNWTFIGKIFFILLLFYFFHVSWNLKFFSVSSKIPITSPIRNSRLNYCSSEGIKESFKTLEIYKKSNVSMFYYFIICRLHEIVIYFFWYSIPCFYLIEKINIKYSCS